jgi:Transglycosylase-like domain
MYVVRPGDSLSAISGRLFGDPAKWPYLYDANRGVVGDNPNMIIPGEKLARELGSRPAYGTVTVATGYRARHASDPPSSGKVWDVTYGYPNYCGDGDGDGWDVSCGAGTSNHVASSVGSSGGTSYSGGSYGGRTPGGSFGQCVVARESGGQAQVMNATGHYGLYQFSASTWAAYGGSPADFGHASVGEQERVFANALAQGGQSNWSLYDGC